MTEEMPIVLIEGCFNAHHPYRCAEIANKLGMFFFQFLSHKDLRVKDITQHTRKDKIIDLTLKWKISNWKVQRLS